VNIAAVICLVVLLGVLVVAMLDSERETKLRAERDRSRTQ
jgi:hypothetical protein